MTPVPPPASPCVRVRLDYTQADDFLAGSRFFLGYGGGAPTAGNCQTLATDIAAAWATHLASLVSSQWTLTEVDVLDITTETGASGQAEVTDAGSDSGPGTPAQVSVNIEYDIARRYRGGKPRMFLPGPAADKLQTASQWTTAYQSSVNTGIAAFMTEIEALSIGAMGALAHVNLSYYKGFTNITNSSGRERAVPTYRDTALVDTVNGYATKLLCGSQRRRRAAVTY